MLAFVGIAVGGGLLAGFVESWMTGLAIFLGLLLGGYIAYKQKRK